MYNLITLPVYELKAFEKLSRTKSTDYIDKVLAGCLFVRVRDLRHEVFYISKYFIAHHYYLAYEATAEDGHYVLDMQKVKGAIRGIAASSLLTFDLHELRNTHVAYDYLKHMDIESFLPTQSIQSCLRLSALQRNQSSRACEYQLFNADYLAAVATFLAGCRPDRPVEWHYPYKPTTPMLAIVPGYDFKVAKNQVCYGELKAILMPCKPI